MSDAAPEPAGTGPERIRPEERLLRGGLTGIALVALATVGLTVAAALIAALVSLAF